MTNEDITIRRSSTMSAQRWFRSGLVNIKLIGNPKSYGRQQATKLREWTESADIELTINYAKLAQHLGTRAIRNASGQATAFSGAIKVVVRKRTETNVRETEIPIPDGYEVVP